MPSLANGDYLQENPVVAILMMMGFAFLFCLCSEADAFVAANFQPINAWPPAAKLAFLVLGPMLDIKLYLMYTRVFRHTAYLDDYFRRGPARCWCIRCCSTFSARI